MGMQGIMEVIERGDVLYLGMVVLIVLVFLVISITTYYISRKSQVQTGELMNSQLLKQQNEYYEARFEETEKQWLALRKIRHDMKKKYVLELSYLDNGEYDKLRQIYTEAIGELETQSKIINTQNVGVDSIINYNIKLAGEKKICVKHDIRVRGDISIENGDLNILLGNLFDNAIEATAVLKEEQREIFFKLYADDTALLFEIENPYNGIICKDSNNRIITSKKDKENHGIGLKAVEEIVKRYYGSMEVEDRETSFRVMVFLYMPKEL